MKQPLVSIIVPTYNSAGYVDRCLRSAINQSYKNTELIVVDNNSTDATNKIAQKYTKKVYSMGPERSAQRNFGAQQSKGSLLLIIDSDMELSPDVVAACVTEYLKGSVKAIVIPEESFGEGFWAQCKKLERSYYIGIDWMEAARFFEKNVFEEMGGYDEKNTGTEDYDLPQRISYAYGKQVIGRVTNLIYHNEQKINLFKTCKKKYYYAKNLNRYRNSEANKKNFSLQSSVLRRYMLFLSNPIKLLRNPIRGAGMLFMKTCEIVSGAAGYLSRIRR